MSNPLSDDQSRLLRLRAQRLSPLASDVGVTAAQVVRDVCGLQAQNLPAAALGVRARSATLIAADVKRALQQERTIVRTWCMRGTLHLIEASDVAWLIPLLGPVQVAANRRRLQALGLDEGSSALALRAVRDVLASRGPLTRGEIAQCLGARGIRTEGQVLPHLIRRAALEGHLCMGPGRGAEPTFVLVRDWIAQGPALARDAALSELARRYMAAYGPAGPEDLAAWSGLGLTEARRALAQIAGQLTQVEVCGQTAWVPRTRLAWLDDAPPPWPHVRLLPWFDTYLLGYASRSLSVAPQYAERINPGGGMIHPTLAVGGRVVATWSARERHKQMDLVVEAFEGLAPDVEPGLQAEVSDLARFLGTEVTLEIVTWPG